MAQVDIPKFSGIKTIDAIVLYLRNLAAALDDLVQKTSRPKIDELDGFIVSSITLAASTEVTVPNTKNYIPRYHLILKQDTADGSVVRGVTTWSRTAMYLKNLGTQSTTVDVLFLR